MSPLRLIAAAALLISAHAPVGPTQDEVLRCYFIEHPNQEPLPLDHTRTEFQQGKELIA